MSELIELWKLTVEYQNWGQNLATFGSIGVIAFAFLEGQALYNQNNTIWKKRSGASISVPWFGFLACYFGAVLVYGIQIRSFTIPFNSLILIVLYIPILVGVWKFKGYKKGEKALLLGSVLMVPAMIWLPWKDSMYLLFSVGALLALFTQFWEMVVQKSNGVVSLYLLSVYTLSTVFWVFYAAAIENYPMTWITSISLCIFIATLIVYWYNWKRRRLADSFGI